MSSWPGTVIPRWRTSSSSRVWVSKASAFRFVSRTVCSSYSLLKLLRPSLSSRRCTDQDSGTVFRSISRLLRHFLSSALAWRHTSSNSVTREVMLSFMDTLIALTCLLYNLTLVQGNYSATSNNMKLVGIYKPTLAVYGWAVTFDTARRGLGGSQPAQHPPRCTKCNSPPR